MLSIIEANKEFDNKFNDVCSECGSQRTHVTKDYNICLNGYCDNCSTYDDLGQVITNM
jgi:hypothetical protein